MNGVPQSGADRCAIAESRVRAYWSNVFTVTVRSINLTEILRTVETFQICFVETFGVHRLWV